MHFRFNYDLQNGADLIWIETETHIGQISAMMDEIKVVPNAKLVYNNSPSFNWTLNFRQQVFDAMKRMVKICLIMIETIS